MVRAWIADVTPLCEDRCYREYYDRLPDFRKEKADALRAVEMKVQSVGAWMLWEKIRALHGLHSGAAFNLSHSGTYVMCAAELDGSSERVGCDLEKIGALKEKIAARFFCREEYAAIFSERTEEARTELFYRYWVLKESFMKATRRGMALPMDSFRIRMGEPPVLTKQPEEFPEQYHYAEYKIQGLPYRMAVCSTDGEIDVRLHTELKL